MKPNPFALLGALLLFLTQVHEAGAQQTWNNGSGNFQWDTTSANWDSTAWVNGSDAFFHDTSVGTITLSEAITANSVTFDTGGYTLTGEDLIIDTTLATGTGGVTIDSQLQGLGEIIHDGGTLGGKNNPNHNFSGGTTINGGTVTVGRGGKFGNGPITVNAGTFQQNQSPVDSLSNDINLAGSTAQLSVAGNFTWRLTGDVSFNAAGVNIHPTSSRVIELAGNIDGTASNIDLQRGTTRILGNWDYTGTINMVRNGAGQTALEISDGRDFPNDIVITNDSNNNPRRIGLVDTTTTGIYSGSIDIGPENNDGLFQIQARIDSTLTVAGVIFSDNNGTGVTKTGAGTVVFTGENTYNDLTNITAGILQVGDADDTTTGGTTGKFGNGGVAIAAGAKLVFYRTNSYALGNVISGSGTVDVNSGTVFFNGANTCTGTHTVADGATLAGAGTISGTTIGNADSTIAPGASTGVAGTLDTTTLDISALAGGNGTLDFDLDTTLASDMIALANGAVLTIGTDLLGLTDFNFNDLGGLEAGTYVLIASDQTISGSVDPADATGTVGSFDATLQISGDGTDIELVLSGGDAYGTWATSQGLVGGDADGLADVENSGVGDGLVNLLEFAFGTDPNALDNFPLAFDKSADGGAGSFTPGTQAAILEYSPLSFTAAFSRRTDHATAGITYIPQFSSDLADWEDSTDTPTRVQGDNMTDIPAVTGFGTTSDTYELVEVPYMIFLTNGQKAKFFRILVNSTGSP